MVPITMPADEFDITIREFGDDEGDDNINLVDAENDLEIMVSIS